MFGIYYDGHFYLRYDLILDQFLDNKDGLRTMKINVRITFPFFFMIDAPMVFISRHIVNTDLQLVAKTLTTV